LLVSRGEMAPALDEARAAVERAALLDDVNLSADAYSALALVLEASGRTTRRRPPALRPTRAMSSRATSSRRTPSRRRAAR